jgi:hypothetical protein
VKVLSFANQKGWLKTMESIIKVGQRFKFTVLTDAPSERQGVVVQVLSNREKGLGLDVDEYMSYWIDARELPETESSTILVFVRSTDGKLSRWQTDRRHRTGLTRPHCLPCGILASTFPISRLRRSWLPHTSAWVLNVSLHPEK